LSPSALLAKVPGKFASAGVAVAVANLALGFELLKVGLPLLRRQLFGALSNLVECNIGRLANELIELVEPVGMAVKHE